MESARARAIMRHGNVFGDAFGDAFSTLRRTDIVRTARYFVVRHRGKLLEPVASARGNWQGPSIDRQ
jgi:hypothetical protein